MQYMYQFNISDDAYKYLYIQRGAISDVKPRKSWEKAFNMHTDMQYNFIKDYLPEECDSVLNIGSGLGGIDVLISKHYNNNVNMELLDGADDDPVVMKHNWTFNNHKVSGQFLKDNGVENFTLSSPNFYTGTRKDLIVSISAYMFHIEPSVYLDLLKKSLKENSVCIFKVRRSTRYLDEISSLFREIRIINRFKKGDLIYLRR